MPRVPVALARDALRERVVLLSPNHGDRSVDRHVVNIVEALPAVRRQQRAHEGAVVVDRRLEIGGTAEPVDELCDQSPIQLPLQPLPMDERPTEEAAAW